MSRRTNASNIGVLYRAICTYEVAHYLDGVTPEWFIRHSAYGPYETIGAAKAAMTREAPAMVRAMDRGSVRSVVWTIETLAGEWQEVG